jgi:hypothetical protein
MRKAAELHLADMQGRHRDLLEAVPDARVAVNQAGKITLLNLPKMDGREVLTHIKPDDSLKMIPNRYPDHFRFGSGYLEELSAPGELLPQQARA